MFVEFLFYIAEGVGIYGTFFEFGVEAADALLEGSGLVFGFCIAFCYYLMCAYNKMTHHQESMRMIVIR